MARSRGSGKEWNSEMREERLGECEGEKVRMDSGVLDWMHLIDLKKRFGVGIWRIWVERIELRSELPGFGEEEKMEEEMEGAADFMVAAAAGGGRGGMVWCCCCRGEKGKEEGGMERRGHQK